MSGTYGCDVSTTCIGSGADAYTDHAGGDFAAGEVVATSYSDSRYSSASSTSSSWSIFATVTGGGEPYSAAAAVTGSHSCFDQQSCD